MGLEEGLFEFLNDVDGLTALVDDRIFPVRLDEGCDLPAVSFQRVPGTRNYTQDPQGGSVWNEARFQLTAWDASVLHGGRGAIGAIEVARELVKALSGFAGQMGDVRASTVQVVLELDGYEAETQMYRRIVDITIGYADPNG